MDFRQGASSTPESGPWEDFRQPATQPYAEEREAGESMTHPFTSAYRFARGAVKTVGGLGVGAAQVLSGGRPLKDAQALVNAPSDSMAEEMGRYAPYLITGPESWLGRAATSAAISGLQPTEEGDLASHATGTAAGGVTGGVLAGADRARRAVGNLPDMHFHWPHIGWHFIPHVGWLGAVASRLAAMGGQRAATAAAASPATRRVTEEVSRRAPAIVGATAETAREAAYGDQ
jgi:hypothetical protein